MANNKKAYSKNMFVGVLFSTYFWGLLIFATYILFSLLSFRNFGITADEVSSYTSGMVWLEYFQNNRIPADLVRFHPLINEHYRLYPMILFAIIGHMKYEIFHLLNMFAFLPVLFMGFCLIILYLPKKWYSVLPLVLVLLTPRILGDIASNPKDMPFSVAYFVSLALVFIVSYRREVEEKHIVLILLGFIFGYSQSIRSIGLTLHLIFFYWSYFSKVKRLALDKSVLFSQLSKTLIIFLMSVLFMSVTWPAIGANFPANFKKYLSLGSDFNLWGGQVYYFGQHFSQGSIPWHYLFVWLSITTPIGFLILFLSGLRDLLHKKAISLQVYLYTIVLLHLFLYLLLTPTIYNGIRHYSFLVLILSFLAGVNLVVLVRRYSTYALKLRILFAAAIVIYLSYLLISVVSLHPFQNLYFNEVTGGLSKATTKFDVDYWGATYVEAASALSTYVKNVPSKDNSVYVCKARTAFTYYLNNKINYAKSMEDADFIICTPKELEVLDFPTTVVGRVSRQGTTLLEIRTPIR